MAGLDRESAALRAPMSSAALRVLDGGQFILGAEVMAFEREIGATVDGAYAVGCASGTDALVLALRAFEIGAGDEVIVPSFTFVATAEAVVLAGATPVFADIDPETFLIDPVSVAGLIGPRTRAIVPVHLFGQCARMEPLHELADRASLYVIEDAAQAIGARWQGRAAGALGHAAAFSFFPTKNLGAPGDGGLVTTTDPAVATRLRKLRSHGRTDRDTYETIGLNSPLDEIHAAILRVKLPHLDAWNERRRLAASRYRAAIGSPALAAPRESEDTRHVYNQFTVRAARRDELRSHLDALGIGSAIYYPTPIHAQPAYASWARDALPVTDRAATEVLSVPVHPWLTDEEIERVADALATVT
ncbi:MAG TPA: DegT/DnrJ/EryC1/StrS family aminotransferase [Polyangia bacterium]|nr:DegT/DnrJ/EryC1/StrS family aminotransferase [Polyangia bacterium]